MSLSSAYKNILIIRQGALGDVVNILPLIKLLRDAFPDSKLTGLTADLTSKLLQSDLCLDDVVTFNRTKAPHRLLPMMLDLKSRHFDLVIDFQGSNCTKWLAWATGAPIRIGSKKPPFYTHQIKFDLRKHQTCDIFRLFLSPLGLDKQEIFPRFPSLVDGIASARQLLDKHQVISPYLVFNPGHSPAWATKSWPDEHWVELGRYFVQQDFSIVVSGGPDDSDLANRISTRIGVGAFNLAGVTNLFELAGIMKLSTGVISTDSGPMHVAAMSGAKVVALFGPTHPVTSAPFGVGHKVLHHHIHCSYCFKKVCPYNHECLDELLPSEVKSSVEQVIGICF